METVQNKQLITTETTVGQAMQFPGVVEILQEAGFHCVGCHANVFEPIGEGALGHGMTEAQVQNLLERLNKAASTVKAEISLTENAIKRVKALLQQQNRNDEGVRVKVVAGGCSGYKYDLNFDKPNLNDIIIDNQGVKIITDQESINHLKGSKIEFVEGLHGSKFEVINPNEASKCGCGHSVGF